MEGQNKASQLSTTYKGLDLEHPDSIRLLRLKAARSEDESSLEIELYTKQLQDVQNEYDALSYTWDLGLQSEKRHILVNRRPLEIGQNLYDFLIQLRNNGVASPLWADAICIDQFSTSERSHQVQLMSRIYSSARSTRTWLGKDLQDVAHLMKEFGDTGSVLWSGTMSQRQTNAVELLDSLLNHRYWTRTWILQEVVLAREVTVHCCRQALPWKAFITVSKRICAKAGLQCLTRHAGSALMQIDVQKNSSSARTLPQLLERYGSTRCADLRDRVFAMVGLIASDEDPLQQMITKSSHSDRISDVLDYSLSPLAIFLRLVKIYDRRAPSTLPSLLWHAFELEQYVPDALEQDQLLEVPAIMREVNPPEHSSYAEMARISAAESKRPLWRQVRFPWFQYPESGLPVRDLYWWPKRFDYICDMKLYPLQGIAVSWGLGDNDRLIETIARETCAAFNDAYIGSEFTWWQNSNEQQVDVHVKFESLRLFVAYLEAQAERVRKPLSTSLNAPKNRIPTSLAEVLHSGLYKYRTALAETQRRIGNMLLDRERIINAESTEPADEVQRTRLSRCQNRVSDELMRIDPSRIRQLDLTNEGLRKLSNRFGEKLIVLNKLNSAPHYDPLSLLADFKPSRLVHVHNDKHNAPDTEMETVESEDDGPLAPVENDDSIRRRRSWNSLESRGSSTEI